MPRLALVVDDQYAVREVLRDGLLSLEADFIVKAVPSAEEALLEIGGQPVDLLVADVRLPGISGLDLMARLRQRFPEMKVILITGVGDPAIRRRVADAGADAFFLKPIELADFLDTVERLFGLVETFTQEGVSAEEELAGVGVAEYLTTVRQELNAISAVLLDAHGRVLVQAGALPDAITQTSMVSRLMAAFSSSEHIAAFLKRSKPVDFMAFAGQNYDLLFGHVGKDYALLVVANRSDDKVLWDNVSRFGDVFIQAIRRLEHILREIGISTEEAEPAPDSAVGSEEIAVEMPLTEALDEPLDEALTSLLETAQIEVDPDSFWESLSEEHATLDGELLGADVLTFDQAQQLGLAPPDEEEAA